MASLVFIHGACSTGLIWLRQQRRFPGAAFPTLPDLSVGDDALIETWAEWLHRTYPGPRWIVAHSLGGAVALTWARHHPDQVMGFVLVGTGPHLKVSPDLLTMLDEQPDRALLQIADWSLSPVAPDSLRKSSRNLIRRVSVARARQEFRAADRFSATAWLDQLVPPVAILVGMDDVMTPPSLTRQFLQVWPSVPYFERESAGLLIMLEQPDWFNAWLTHILPRDAL